jgi:hypothetical protein
MSDDRNDNAGTAWIEGLFWCDDGDWMGNDPPGHQQIKASSMIVVGTRLNSKIQGENI